MQDIKTEIESHLRSDLLLVILPPMTLFTDNGRLNEKNINRKKRFRLHHISPEFIRHKESESELLLDDTLSQK